MTKKLEQLFDLDSLSHSTDPKVEIPISSEEIMAIDRDIDKIDSALPAVRGLESSDKEMDELADMAKQSYNDLMDLGMQVDSRFASDIFSVASNMLGHAITAKTAKLDKKLKMIDLQMKKARLDLQTNEQEPPAETGHGMILNRNDLLERILSKDQKPDKG